MKNMFSTVENNKSTMIFMLNTVKRNESTVELLETTMESHETTMKSYDNHLQSQLENAAGVPTPCGNCWGSLQVQAAV